MQNKNVLYKNHLKQCTRGNSNFVSSFTITQYWMKILILVLAVLLAQETIAWDMKSWGNWWWKQDTTPVKSKHHKHHKHYRHHHHHPQVCIPQPTTTRVRGTPSPIPIPIEESDPFFPYNIGGMLNDTGVNCSDSLTTQAVSTLMFTCNKSTTDHLR